MSLEIGVLSAAHAHVDAYAGILASRENVSLAGIADDDRERGRAAADRHGTAYVDDADRLLGDVDATVICSANTDHREWFERAAAANVDVLCEKPLAPTIEDASAMVEVWEETGIVAGVAMPLRFCEPVRRARSILEAGVIGPIRAISGTNRGKMPGGWFADPERAGGGAVMDHTVHVVDLVFDLLDAEIAEVYAEIGTCLHDISLEDVNVLSMELADGTPFFLDGSWSKPDSWHTWGDATLELTGAEGTVAVDYTDQSLVHTVASGSDAGVHTSFYGTDANAGLLDDFLDSVRAGRDPEITPADGLAAVAVVEAAYESAERGAPVPVETGD